MQNLKYLERIVDEETRFGIILNEFAQKHTEHIQLKISLSLLEFFNGGKFVDENDIKKIDDVFYMPKSKPITSKVFAVRISLSDSQDIIDEKIDKLKENINLFKNL